MTHTILPNGNPGLNTSNCVKFSIDGTTWHDAPSRLNTDIDQGLPPVVEPESVKVLRECAELQLKKSRDYQNPNSRVKQAMHYRRGVDTIYDIMHGKMLRIQSLLESDSETPNFESLEDSFKDLINYGSFAVSYLRGKMDGQ